MGRKTELLGKTFKTIKEEGFRICVIKIGSYLADRIAMHKPVGDPEPDEVCMDVLFINGCYLPHPARYRVTHQREQLSAANIMSEEIFYDQIDVGLVKRYRAFIFYRCVYTEAIEAFIQQAKKMNKVVIYDIDDLVIDTKYTNRIKYLSTMSERERKEYDSGVERMGRTLRMCDAAITTTERLAEELGHYVPQVFINRNVASDEMVGISKDTIYKRDILPNLSKEEVAVKKENKKYKIAKREQESRKGIIRIGYFSGSITHNDDVELILKPLEQIMDKYSNVELHIVGELDIPEQLKAFSSRIIARPFVNWKELPNLIGSVDINLAPLEKSIFNEAKSENKWVEAALVKVVTVASRLGAFEKMVEDGVTGILCSTEEEWFMALDDLVANKEKRETIAENAYQYAIHNCTSVYTSINISTILRSLMKSNIAFILPSIQISGGVLVVLNHCMMLQDAGYDVTVLNDDIEETDIEKNGHVIPVLSRQKTQIHTAFDKVVATLWATTGFLQMYPKIKDRYYLVQGYETDFFENGEYFRIAANQTYHMNYLPIHYITISQWCKNWLNDLYHQNSKYAPNGIDFSMFSPIKRDYNTGKIRILVEGNCNDYYKNVDESFHIVDKLDKNKYEIWYMSYLGKPKESYYVDKFLYKVPYEQVPEVYRSCHIMIKSSILESFSYPPLEMMATGGQVVVVPNDGNVEYLVDQENCSFYERGNVDSAVEAIERIVKDSSYREKLYTNGIEVAKKRDWSNLTGDILHIYQADSQIGGSK